MLVTAKVWSNVVEAAEISKHFTGAVVATGNYHTPKKMNYPGLLDWIKASPDTIIHAIDYKTSKDFVDKVR